MNDPNYSSQPARPTWVEVDLAAIANNMRLLVELAAPAQVMAVLKANAYGHGLVKVAGTVLNSGAMGVGLATLGEAIVLRQAGLTAPVLVLSYLPAWQVREALRYNVSVTVFSEDIAQALHRAAVDLHRTALVHVKVDTGMGRLGLRRDEVLPFFRAIDLPGLKVEGLFTQFATADETDSAQARAQLRRFQEVLAQLDRVGLRPPLVHAANTAGLLNLPEARFDLARPGIGIYGLHPSRETLLPEGFRPALAFKTTVGQVKKLPPHSPIGSGAYRTRSDETLAILPVGYADGFRRGPQTWREVLVRGRRAPLVGRVSMDQCVINVSHIDEVGQGDEVTLIGQQGAETITAEEVAAWLGTSNYEVVTQLLARIPRVY